MRSIKLPLAALVLALSFGLTAYAESPREELAHAYRLLKHADADYQGHRALAMEEVRVAGKELGLVLEGELSEHERQFKSDKHLVEARRLLREAREKLEVADRDRVASHVDKAIKEINLALDVK